MQKIISNIIIIILLFSSCSNNYRHEKEIVENLVGNEVIIPEELKYQILETPFEYDLDNSDYKIITYIDSTGCTSCNMNLTSRNATIDEFKSLRDIDINYLMIINSKDNKGIINLLKMGEFRHPVVIDAKGEFVKYNEIPAESVYRTFLLDNFNRVLAVGDPVKNPKIKDLYKKIMSDNKFESSSNKISLVNKPVRNIGLINRGDTINLSFSMFNKDSLTFHIQDVIPSCDCLRVESERFVLDPGEGINIKIQFVTDSVGTTFSKFVDIFYEEKEKPERLTVYGYLR